jgi:hypothetical protein
MDTPTGMTPRAELCDLLAAERTFLASQQNSSATAQGSPLLLVQAFSVAGYYARC